MSRLKQYRLFLNMTETDVTNTAIVEPGVMLVNSVREAIDLLIRCGHPVTLVVYGFLTNNLRDRNGDTIWRYVNTYQEYLRQEEIKGYWAENPTQVTVFQPSSMFLSMTADRLQAETSQHEINASQLVRNISDAFDGHTRQKVMLRRHQKAMKELGVRFETFVRLGRWGGCVDCPRVATLQGEMILPELCVNTHEGSHNFGLDDLTEQYNSRMRND